MPSLPVIVGFGGMNTAGRTSGFHSYKRLVSDVLSAQDMESTWRDLAHRMQLPVGKNGVQAAVIEEIKAGTLVRKIDTFDPGHVPTHLKAQLSSSATFVLKASKLPHPIPENWQVREIDAHTVEVSLRPDTDILLSVTKALAVSSAGSLPKGFDPSLLYSSHHHPRGLSLTIYGASDALHMLGIDWDTVLSHIAPDEVSVYAGSALSQIDENSYAGLIGDPLRGHRVNSKMMPMALTEMPADFINSYVINSVGQTGTQVGACASFLYNLKQGLTDIKSGRAKVAIIGNAEAPIVPAVIDGFHAMGALASDESLRLLDHTQEVNHRRACRPFSNNTGFTMAEGAQFVILMADELAVTLGASIYGSVPDVFVNADGNKKSIAKPGVGNYLTFAKTAALAKAMLGQEGLQQSIVFAHGTGTPQNRVTESHILNEVAKTHGIEHWPVAAIKSYLGHSISAAAGDQLMVALGVWKYGYVPGIKTIDHIAEDVHCSHLDILLDHHFAGEAGIDCSAALLNSKGFGGNNATGLILSPHETKALLIKKHGKDWLSAYEKKNEKVMAQANLHDQAACEGQEKVYYDFGTQVMEEQDVSMTTTSVKLSRFKTKVTLPTTNPY
ncbi:MAG: beta-ketoacyl synthase [Gammaproteobacteria bacterium]|nr:beta-ketoacyl synthase [Gammaproteobacteria bacterium]